MHTYNNIIILNMLSLSKINYLSFNINILFPQINVKKNNSLILKNKCCITISHRPPHLLL